MLFPLVHRYLLEAYVKESNLSKTQVYDADEIFITGTASEIIAVVQVDDACIGSGKPGPITVYAYAKIALE